MGNCNFETNKFHRSDIAKRIYLPCEFIRVRIEKTEKEINNEQARSHNKMFSSNKKLCTYGITLTELEIEKERKIESNKPNEIF